MFIPSDWPDKAAFCFLPQRGHFVVFRPFLSGFVFIIRCQELTLSVAINTARLSLLFFVLQRV